MPDNQEESKSKSDPEDRPRTVQTALGAILAASFLYGVRLVVEHFLIGVGLSTGILAVATLIGGFTLYSVLKHYKLDSTPSAFGAYILLLILFAWLVSYQARYLPREFELQADAGWQDTGFQVREGAKLKITVKGRISLSMNQSLHVTDLLKAILINAGAPIPENVGRNYPAPTLTNENRFDRWWTNYEGDQNQSDVFEQLKMSERSPWGVVLCAVHSNPKPDIQELDPWNAGIAPDGIQQVPASDGGPNQYMRSGHLVCMVNDAVISNAPAAPQIAKIYFAKIGNAPLATLQPDGRWRIILDERHSFDRDSIPQLLLADNSGSYKLTIAEQ